MGWNDIFSISKVEPLKLRQTRTISFSSLDAPEGGVSHIDPFLTLSFRNYSRWKIDLSEENKIWSIDRILVDTGSSVDILFYNAFKTMVYKDSDVILYLQ